MTGNSDPSGSDLDARLRAARQRLEEEKGPPGGRSGMPRTLTGLALRVGVELVAGLVVGGGIGWLLDSWLGTSPAMLIVFFILGAAAGIMTVYKTAQAINQAGNQAGAEDGDKDRGGSP